MSGGGTAGGRIAPGVGANLIGQHAQDRNQDATVYMGNLDPQVGPLQFVASSNCIQCAAKGSAPNKQIVDLSGANICRCQKNWCGNYAHKPDQSVRAHGTRGLFPCNDGFPVLCQTLHHTHTLMVHAS